MTELQKLSEALAARTPVKIGARAGNWQEFIVLFSPAGKLRCKVLDGKSAQPRPFIFGRGETEAFPDSLQGSRIIATPEGNPSCIFAAGWPTNAKVRISVFFFSEGAMSGDTFVYQKEDGQDLQLNLFAVIDGNPVQIYSTTIEDLLEHSTIIQIPKA
jgi:hypothetical protein